MAYTFWDTLWHKTLRRPYRLANVYQSGTGKPIILLHGIGRTGLVWKHVQAQLPPADFMTVAFDLLGFGRSPKPDWLQYTADDHAAAVIHSIAKLRLREPAIIVGHSMGCIVAVRVARLRPDLVKHLVLYEMPLYEGLPKKRMYQARINLYFKLYNKIVQYQPAFNRDTARFAEKAAAKIAGFEVTRQSWLPFVRSLENTIMKQSTKNDLQALSIPSDIIYGVFDMLVIRGKPAETFGKDNSFITPHTVRARHTISAKASRFIVQRIQAAEHPERIRDKKVREAVKRGQLTKKSAQ